MIEELHIRDLGVIEDASLRLSPGLTVVTGETGAGKTMLVTALQLLLGARADAGLVRHGSSAALAEIAVSPPPPEAADWLTDDDEMLIVSREIPAEGRSRARIGGRLAPISALADVLGRHVEVHAQHEHVRLARPEVQRELLDRFAGDPHARSLDQYRHAFEDWRTASEAVTRLEQDARERARQLDRLRAEVEEIDAAGLDPDVDGELDRELAVLEHADEVRAAAAVAQGSVSSEGAGEPVGVAIDALRRLDVDDPQLDELRERLSGVAAELTELSVDLLTYGEAAQADPQRLEALQSRRHLIGQLTRKFGASIAEVLAYRDDAQSQISVLEEADAQVHDLEDRRTRARSAAEGLAADIRRGRVVAAERLSTHVDEHLRDLGMPDAAFTVAVEALPDGQLAHHGADTVTYLLAPNPGEGSRALASASSGGERSRVSLAIEVALADVDQAQVLVFDEVDAGIGGATAMAVGAKLARLAAGEGTHRRQVLCVTHLAQLAAFADVHHVVEKGVAHGRTVTTARLVADDGRVAELSRMLGGDETADAGLEHARALLERAQQRRAS